MTTEMAVFHRFRAFGYEVISDAQLIKWRASERWAEKLSGVVNLIAGPRQFSILVVDAQGDGVYVECDSWWSQKQSTEKRDREIKKSTIGGLKIFQENWYLGSSAEPEGSDGFQFQQEVLKCAYE
ncbi:hypothetical protein TEQG_06125 [Trichophyton equinum CBS 127.97]|uniref:Uncharacterized protein n=1 Tax=Trichophyton equinum (strain ATCC MYA-4606 / CBS 127.97) TaxID=559882 RepID=F2PZ19_TRIEC|nr:hypothetical protein TEQG_06125 [Trichophyton equinum CBS 127.97]